MQERRTHTFILSARELRAALKMAFPENLRVATMPEAFTLTADGSGIVVGYTLAIVEHQ